MFTRSRHWSENVFPSVLVDRNGAEKVTVTALKRKKAVGVFFSAQWSAACQTFAPHLAAFYDACKNEDEDALEVVLVSSDRNDTAFREYLNTMPWLAVPFAEASATARLTGLCQVRGIPALVIFDGATGRLQSITAHADVSRPGITSIPLRMVGDWLGREIRVTSAVYSMSAASTILVLLVLAFIYLICLR